VAHLAPAVAVTPQLVTLHAATPGKILAGGKAGTEVVTVHNYGTIAETETVTITLAPSLDGVNPAGSYSTPGVTETVTIKKHGSASIKVPFVPPITLIAGKYHTLATVSFNQSTTTLTAPGTYTLTLPPLPTTAPTLIGRWVGLIIATSSESTGFFGGGTSTTVHEASMIWETTAQNLTSLTGLFAVGDQNASLNGDSNNLSMQGYELTNGVIHFTLTSDNINYKMDGKVTNNGTKITGLFKGTLVNNIFKNLGGKFTLNMQVP
jgi:hypothetical protein